MHLIDAGNRHLYETELHDLHLARAQVFVDGFGWDLPLTDGLDIDQFDDDRARHIVGFDTRENVVMSFRLRPADDKSLLGDVFANSLADDARPLTDGLTWEATRGFCVEFGKKPWNMKRKGACMAAPLELLHSLGMNRLVAFTDTRMFNWVTNMGWNFRIMGDSISYGETGAGFALEVDIDTAAIATIRARWQLDGPGYVYIEQLKSRETVHDAARRLALARGQEDLLPRDDFSRIRRRVASSAKPLAPPPAPRRPLGERRAAA